MQSDPHFFLVWTHRSGESIFGAAAKPVIRNGELLCFPNEERARAECDRLNAGIGAPHMHYTVKPAHAQTLKKAAEDFSLLPKPSTSACTTFAGKRSRGAPAIAVAKLT